MNRVLSHIYASTHHVTSHVNTSTSHVTKCLLSHHNLIVSYSLVRTSNWSFICQWINESCHIDLPVFATQWNHPLLASSWLQWVIIYQWFHLIQQWFNESCYRAPPFASQLNRPSCFRNTMKSSATREFGSAMSHHTSMIPSHVSKIRRVMSHSASFCITISSSATR